VAPPLLTSAGERWPLTPALPLSAVALAVLTGGGLSPVALRSTFGPRTLELLRACCAPGGGSTELLAEADLSRDVERGFAAVGQSLCVLTAFIDRCEDDPAAVVKSGAMLLSESLHVLAGARISEALAGKRGRGLGAAFRCQAESLSSSTTGEVGSSSGGSSSMSSSCTARVLHVFSG
ncbi:unnamed protein product, partial [Polarella glacialis]